MGMLRFTQHDNGLVFGGRVMRGLVVACLVAFALGLGVTVAYRMQTEAMAVVVGVLCGVSGTIPVSLLVLYAARSAREQPKPTPPPAQPPQTPQIIVVSPSLPPQGAQWPYPAYPADPGALARPSRDFTIIGDDD